MSITAHRLDARTPTAATRRATRGRARRTAGLCLIALSLAACSATSVSTNPTRSSTSDTSSRSAANTPTATTSVISAAGPWIAYQWVRADGDGIYLMRPDGSDVHPLLTSSSPSTYHPSWSPDGKRIAYESVGPKAQDIWIANPDGSGAHVLVNRSAECATVCGPVYNPTWSHDGRSIAFVRYDIRGDKFIGGKIEVVDVASGARRVIYSTSRLAAPENPRWSPDDASIVFTLGVYPNDLASTDKASSESVWLLDSVDGHGKARPLTPPKMWASYPDWNPHGDLIVFTTYDTGMFQATDEPSNLYTIHADGSGMKRITNYGRAEQRAVEPHWTPDGKSIIFCLLEDSPPPIDGPRHAAFINEDGSGLTEILTSEATHPVLQPTG
jgi:Tol biopolymer transport system component